MAAADPVTRREWIRFIVKVDIRAVGECWPWKGYIGGSGHGRFHRVFGPVHAHRFMYRAMHGPIDAYEHVRITCENLACVNPGHLVKQTDLMLRRLATKEQFGHCIHGHKLNWQNLYMYNDSKGREAKRCKTCHKAKSMRRYYRLRSANITQTFVANGESHDPCSPASPGSQGA